MKAKSTLAFVVVVFLALLLLSGCGCLLGEACNSFWTPVVHATETSAANDLHIQLTAIAP